MKHPYQYQSPAAPAGCLYKRKSVEPSILSYRRLCRALKEIVGILHTRVQICIRPFSGHSYNHLTSGKEYPPPSFIKICKFSIKVRGTLSLYVCRSVGNDIANLHKNYESPITWQTG